MKYCTPLPYGMQSISCVFPLPPHKAMSKKPNVSREAIIETVCSELDIEREQLLGLSRKIDFTDPRKMTIHIIRILLPKLSLKSTGSIFSGRDHSTILWAFDSCEELLGTDKIFRKKYNNIMTEIKLNYEC